ncbi:MAG: Gfo/Idh/MocA family oxidoreductase [Bdellovibrionota bacterium]
MRVIVAGLGIQGAKRSKFAGSDLVATVDPVKPDAQFTRVQDVPLESYDAALVCTPDEAKIEILSYLLDNGKHVLVEKPLVSEDDRDIERLRDLAAKRRVFCYTAYNHRFEPFLVRAREIITAGEIGKVLSLEMFYGNGTAREVRNSVWRDKGMGVLADLGSHLLDTTDFLLGEHRTDLKPFSYYRLENNSYDHVVFGSQAEMPRIQLEATLLSWRNTFRLDVIGDAGSLHVNCLCKWGPSTITVRKRVLPSGRPTEASDTLECADPTWKLEYEYFVEHAKRGGTNLDNDLWINRTLRKLYEEGK